MHRHRRKRFKSKIHQMIEHQHLSIRIISRLHLTRTNVAVCDICVIYLMSISFSILHHFYLWLPICLLSNIEWIVYKIFWYIYWLCRICESNMIYLHKNKSKGKFETNFRFVYLFPQLSIFHFTNSVRLYSFPRSLSLFFPVDLISCWRWWKWMGLVLLFWPLDSLDRCIPSVYYVWFYVQTFTEPSHTMQFRRWSYIRWINFTWPTTW